MEKYKELLNFSSPEMVNFCKKHYVILATTAVAGVGVFALRRYFKGGVCSSKALLNGKTVVITGANTGIGKETARELARRGARVILACRDITKAERAAEDIRRETNNENVLVKVIDLANLASVRKFCEDYNKNEPKLDILINNAGVMSCPAWQTDDGFEMQLGVNHLGHFLLTQLLLDKLQASAPSRVITLSSLAHERGSIDLDDLNFEKRQYDSWKAYGQSKLANVLFSAELSRRYKGAGISAFSVHPGVVQTELGRYLTQTGIPQWKLYMFRFLFAIVIKTPWQGAQTTLHCALEEGLEQYSGQYFSDCGVKQASAAGRDMDMAARLWSASERLVGINN